MTEEQKEAAAEPSKEEMPHGNTQGTQAQETQEAPQKEKAGLQEALLAERRKRQEAEALNKYLQQQNQNYQAQYNTKQAVPQEEEDEYTREIKQYTEAKVQQGIRESMERQYMSSHPEMLEQDPVSGRTMLEEKLEPILKKRPYLAQAIQAAENRYAMAMEIINDWSPKGQSEENRKRLEENASKPGNPAGVAKSANLNQLEHIKGMSRKEFSEYRAKIRGRAPNIR